MMCRPLLAHSTFKPSSQTAVFIKVAHMLSEGAYIFVLISTENTEMTSHPVEQLHSQANSLVAKFKQGEGTQYISDAIVLDREALELCSPGHHKRAVCLTRLASHLWHRCGGIEDLNEAIALDRNALALRPPGPLHLSNLALHLFTRYQRLGGMQDLDEAITLARDALALCPLGHPNRSLLLNNLICYLSTRYRRLWKMEDVDESIVLARDTLARHPQGDPCRSTCLDTLAMALFTRYRQIGDMEDLGECIALAREALALHPPGHQGRAFSLDTLAVAISPLNSQFGKMDDLNEAILLARDALALRPPGHPWRSDTLNNLANRLFARYGQLGGIEDVNEAIDLARDALASCTPADPDWSMLLNNLATHLAIQYERFGEMEDLDEAIHLNRDALLCCPQGHPGRLMPLNNLASCLSARYSKLQGMVDLNEAIFLARDAVALCPAGHPSRSTFLVNLSKRLSTRYKQIGSMIDLDEAILIAREALELSPPGHSQRPCSLHCLADNLHTRFTQLREIADREEFFGHYAKLADVSQIMSFTDLSAATAWIDAAEDLQHSTILLAYRTSLRLLVHHLVALPSLPQHLPVFKKLTSSLAVDAFSACLRNHSFTTAIELLEQGRGVFWSQLTRLRSPLDDVIASGPAGKTLADEFTRLTSLIRQTLNSPVADQHDQVCHLNLDLEKVVRKIRELPGLSRFLLPAMFSDLQRAASDGPVIIVNASKYSCDALVVLVDKDPVHIPLSITREDVRKLSSRLRTVTVCAKWMDVTNDLGPLLRELWDDVVEPVVKVLQTIHPIHARIWWCPTAEFTLLPLHAAGPYRKGQRNLSGLYISSYTPTLSALIRARQHDHSHSRTERKRFVAIGQAKAMGESELPFVGTELANVSQLVGRLVTFTRIEGAEACMSRVSEELAKNDWVHLACHGLANRQRPFDSAFALHDGRFTIQHILQRDLENPEFAYLSACHTTVGDEQSPDEVIHLAAAMQFAGFRSVIGTMWAVDDGEANKVTSVFYKHMVDGSGRLDHTRAAYALNKTMKSTRMPLDQRILYIHLGA